MNPITHGLVGWTLAMACCRRPRHRLLVTIASVIPDFDGLGLAVDLATRNGPHPSHLFEEWHHILGHNLGAALVFTALGAALARERRARTAALVALSFHLHLLGDVLGSRGPDGYQWPIPYLLPFSDAWQWAWSGQWLLDAWPNIALTMVLLAWTLWSIWKRALSPFELIWPAGHRALVTALRDRFGPPSGG